MDISSVNERQEERILETFGTNDSMQPQIAIEKDEEYKEEDVIDDKEKELLEDKLRMLQKEDVVESISNLQMKPNKLF